MTTDDPVRTSDPPRGSRPHLIESKLIGPRIHPGTVHRTRVLRLIRDARDLRLVSIVAPPGYGKTRVLAQWAAAADRRVAWLRPMTLTTIR